ncbi:MAG TPA: hypothetical protein PKZ41_00935, partial [Candidatus Omnitrophota bacterium]|nr:hypothetical protein [Candidatus Omnitrophota bacterium]
MISGFLFGDETEGKGSFGRLAGVIRQRYGNTFPDIDIDRVFPLEYLKECKEAQKNGQAIPRFDYSKVISDDDFIVVPYKCAGRTSLILVSKKDAGGQENPVGYEWKSQPVKDCRVTVLPVDYDLPEGWDKSAEIVAGSSVTAEDFAEFYEVSPRLDTEALNEERSEEKDIFDVPFDEILENSSPDTYNHTLRVRDIALRIAEELGVSPGLVKILGVAAYSHDVGNAEKFRPENKDALKAINEGLHTLANADRTEPVSRHLMEWLEKTAYKFVKDPEILARAKAAAEETGDTYPIWRLYISRAALGKNDLTPEEESVARNIFSHGAESLRVLEERGIRYPEEMGLIVASHHDYSHLEAVLIKKVAKREIAPEKADEIRLLNSILIVSDSFEQGNNYERMVVMKGKDHVEDFGATINGWIKTRFEKMEHIGEKRPLEALKSLLARKDPELLDIIRRSRGQDKLELTENDESFIAALASDIKPAVTKDVATRAAAVFSRFRVVPSYTLNASKDPNDPKEAVFREGLERFRSIFEMSDVKVPFAFEDQCRSEDEIDKIEKEGLFSADTRTLHLKILQAESEEKAKTLKAGRYELNLANRETAELISDENSVLYRIAERMNPEYVSVHLSASVEDRKFATKYASWESPVPGSPLIPRGELLKRFASNISTLRENLRNNGYKGQVLVESLDYHDSGAYEYITEPAFIKELLAIVNKGVPAGKDEIGLLVDCSHVVLAARNLALKRSGRHDPECDFMGFVSEIVNDETISLVKELHLVVPEYGDNDKEFNDTHLPFTATGKGLEDVKKVLEHIFKLRRENKITQPLIVNFESDVMTNSAEELVVLSDFLGELEKKWGEEDLVSRFSEKAERIQNYQSEYFDRLINSARASGDEEKAKDLIYRKQHIEAVIDHFKWLTSGEDKDLERYLDSMDPENKTVQGMTPDRNEYLSALVSLRDKYSSLDPVSRMELLSAVILHDYGYGYDPGIGHCEEGAMRVSDVMEECGMNSEFFGSLGIDEESFKNNVSQIIRHHDKLPDIGTDFLREDFPANNDPILSKQLLLVTCMDTAGKLVKKDGVEREDDGSYSFGRNNNLSAGVLGFLSDLSSDIASGISDDAFIRLRFAYGGMKRVFQMSRKGLMLDEADVDKMAVWAEKDKVFIDMWGNVIRNRVWPLFKLLKEQNRSGDYAERLFKLKKLLAYVAKVHLGEEPPRPLNLVIEGNISKDDTFKGPLLMLEKLFSMPEEEITLEAVRSELEDTRSKSVFGLDIILEGDAITIRQPVGEDSAADVKTISEKDSEAIKQKTQAAELYEIVAEIFNNRRAQTIKDAGDVVQALIDKGVAPEVFGNGVIGYDDPAASIVKKVTNIVNVARTYGVPEAMEETVNELEASVTRLIAEGIVTDLVSLAGRIPKDTKGKRAPFIYA